MATVKIRIQTQNGERAPIVPVVIPNIEDVVVFAKKLHDKGQLWVGEAFGWPAEKSATGLKNDLYSRRFLHW